jgi:preprotein translocase subunit SecA
MLPPQVEAIALSANPQETQKHYGVKSCPNRSWSEIFQVLRQADVFIWGGGSLMQDVTSLGSPLYYGGLMLLAQLLGLKTVAWAQGIGPLNHPLTRWLTRTVLRRCSAVSVRDQASQDLLKTWQVSAEIFPTQISKEAETVLKEAVKVAVSEYGLQSLTELEAEDKLAIASEKAPTKDLVIQKLREAYNLIRKEYEKFTSKEHSEVVELGGLHVIGTERHESRRIDNQLRGRAGRQGDPGSTRFFLSLGDNLLRIFGGDRVAGLMEAFRVEEDMPIESRMLTGSLENAQKKVETYYYDIRKQVFEYDEVMNNQRKAIYAERRRVLEGFDLKEQVLVYAEKTMDEIVDAYVNMELPPEEWDLENMLNKAKEFIYLLEDVTVEDMGDMTVPEMKIFFHEEVRKAYDLKEHQVDQVRPGLMREAERFFILQQIDNLWREHLQSMEALRESIGLRGYGQKDPLIEYKQEGYEMFLEMMIDIRRNVVYSLFQFQPQPQPQAV